VRGSDEQWPRGWREKIRGTAFSPRKDGLLSDGSE
jgi:hypothetical protein